MLVSNEALTALKWFNLGDIYGGDRTAYNDVVRWLYDALYRMNVECDFVWPESENLEDYKVIVVPALYAAPDSLLSRLNQYVKQGGTLIATFKTAFANENVKVSHKIQPRILKDCLGIHYDQFTYPHSVGLTGEVTGHGAQARTFMELLTPDGAEVLARYDHYSWKDNAAITRNSYGKGHAYYIGCMTDQTVLSNILVDVLCTAGVETLETTSPVIVRKGQNGEGKTICFFFNYSAEEKSVHYRYADGEDLLTGIAVHSGDALVIGPWDLRIIEVGGSRCP